MWAPIHNLVPLTDNAEARIPPAPTELNFPTLPAALSSQTRSYSLSELENIFRVKQIRLLNADHLSSVITELRSTSEDLEQLVPPEYYPPASWQEPMVKHEGDGESSTSSEPASSEMLSNGASVPGRETFYNRIKELSFNADEVYKALSRQPGAPNLRVVHFRKFWVQLKQIGSFWDASKDNIDFRDPAVLQAYTKQEAERTRSKKSARSLEPLRSPDAKSMPPPRSWSGTADSPSTISSTSKQSSDSSEPTSKADPSPQIKYTGCRDSCGSEMPGGIRTETIKSFIEPIANAFGCLVDGTIRQQPRLRVGTTKLDVDYVARIYRGPNDRGRSRAGIREGPLMVVQCTHELDFSGVGGGGRSGGGRSAGGSRSRGGVSSAGRSAEAEAAAEGARYIFRELGALLAIAIERDRENREEHRFGAGQWWAEKPRNGASGGICQGTPLVEDDGTVPDAETADTVTEDLAGAEGTQKKDADPPGVQKGIRKTVRRKMLARSHQPPESTWEKSVDYTRIGMAEKDETDTIYLLSCLNHHAALVKMRVHPRFLAHLDRDRTDPASCAPGEPFPDWYGVQLARSRWHDLFVENDRVVLARALWGVMGWLMRRTGSGNEKMEVDA